MSSRFPWRDTKLVFERTCKVALIGEPRLGCDFGKSAVANCKQLPPSQYTLFPNILSKRTVEMLGESPTQINWVNTHFSGDVL